VGLSITNPSAAVVTPNRLQTKADTGGLDVLTSTTATSNTNTAAGSWAQVTASSSAEYLLLGVDGFCTLTNAATTGWWTPASLTSCR
jgi:hypothetical protein